MSYKKSKVKKEKEYTYKDKYQKKTLIFKPKPDEIVATFHAEIDEVSVHDVMGEVNLSISRNVNFERGFTVFHIADESDTTVSDTLEAQQNIANTLPAMVDAEGNTRYFLPDEFTVQFQKGVTKQKIQEILDQNEVKIIKEQRTPGYYTLAVPEGKGLFETLNLFSELEEVLFAEPSEAGFNDALYIPNDPDFPQQWGFHNTGQTVQSVTGTIDADIDMPQAWNLSRGKRQVVIAVIDTGCDQNHPDLVNNYLPRGTEDWDFADAGDPIPEEYFSTHGSHVAGIAAAVDNASGVIGVAPRCYIMPLRINLIAGMNANRADAINYVADQAVAHPNRRYVINCSWKASGTISAIGSAIINANNNNVVIVFAAGNTYHGAVTYPAKYPEVIAVASTNSRDRVADHSAVGPEVDVCAPGDNILSTIPVFNSSGIIYDHDYGYKDGTSMASPHVAGLAALVWSLNKNLTNQQVRQLIENNCDNIDGLNPAFTGKLGHGRINARRTLRATPIGVTQLRKFKFPQMNAGSSSALTLIKSKFGYLVKTGLLFLTQKAYSEKIYMLNPKTGKKLREIDPVANDTIGSMTWDGNVILVANVTWGAGLINAINPITGAQIRSIPAPPGRGEGLTYDGKYLYYSTITRIHVIDPLSGVVKRSYPAPGGECRALTYGDGYLFSGNSTTGEITVFNRFTLAVRGKIKAPGTGKKKVEGLAYDSRRNELFVANQSENLIYVLKISV